MTLEAFYFLSMSTAATLSCFILALILVWCVWLVWRLREVFIKINKIATAADDMAEAIKSFTVSTSDRFVALERLFLTAHGISQIAVAFADAWHSRKKDNAKKEPKNT